MFLITAQMRDSETPKDASQKCTVYMSIIVCTYLKSAGRWFARVKINPHEKKRVEEQKQTILRASQNKEGMILQMG